MKISFILPVYKVELYLRECVESIINQTYRNIEVILVDDGSPDNCPAICEQLASEDNRIKVLHKKNGGLSDARNAGLSTASGDYVIFVDSDDFWMGNDSLQKMISLIEKFPQCQFYTFNCSYYYPHKNKYIKWKEFGDDLQYPVNGSEALKHMVASGIVPMSACMRLIDRQWLLDSGITFKVGQISEDIPWFIDLLDKCDKCIFVNNYIYAYRQNVAGSITASKGERNFNSLLNIVKTELDIYKKRSFTSDAIEYLLSFLAYEVSILISEINTLPKEKQSAARKEIKSFCWLLKYKQNPKVKKVSIIYETFGLRATELTLRLYNWYKTRRK